jgi:PTS system nitrogen regulatory IIA component
MTATHAIEHTNSDSTHTGSSRIGTILERGGITVGLQVTSKKKLLEYAAEKFAQRLPQLDAGQIFTTLIDREKLGSTGIGHGVALPHGRIEGLNEVVGIFLQLQQPIDFDAADHLPVNIVFALLVPQDATEEHLKLLADLAAIFRDDEKREKLLHASDISQIRDIFDSTEIKASSS